MTRFGPEQVGFLCTVGTYVYMCILQYRTRVTIFFYINETFGFETSRVSQMTD